MAIPKPRYLGDGVYASFDGFHICLAVNNHRNHVVSLDPEVFEALLKFSNEIKGLAEVATPDVKDEPNANN